MSRAMRSHDGHHFAQPVGMKGFATRRPCQTLEHARVLFLIFFVEQADGVNDGVRLSGQCHHLGQAMLARVVAAITDHDQHFLVPTACPQFLQRLGDGVVQRRHGRR